MTIRQPVLSDWILEAMARKLPDKGGKRPVGKNTRKKVQKTAAKAQELIDLTVVSNYVKDVFGKRLHGLQDKLVGGTADLGELHEEAMKLDSVLSTKANTVPVNSTTAQNGPVFNVGGNRMVHEQPVDGKLPFTLKGYGFTFDTTTPSAASTSPNPSTTSPASQPSTSPLSLNPKVYPVIPPFEYKPPPIVNLPWHYMQDVLKPLPKFHFAMLQEKHRQYNCELKGSCTLIMAYLALEWSTKSEGSIKELYKTRVENFRFAALAAALRDHTELYHMKRYLEITAQTTASRNEARKETAEAKEKMEEMFASSLGRETLRTDLAEHVKKGGSLGQAKSFHCESHCVFAYLTTIFETDEQFSVLRLDGALKCLEGVEGFSFGLLTFVDYIINSASPATVIVYDGHTIGCFRQAGGKMVLLDSLGPTYTADTGNPCEIARALQGILPPENHGEINAFQFIRKAGFEQQKVSKSIETFWNEPADCFVQLMKYFSQSETSPKVQSSVQYHNSNNSFAKFHLRTHQDNPTSSLERMAVQNAAPKRKCDNSSDSVVKRQQRTTINMDNGNMNQALACDQAIRMVPAQPQNINMDAVPRLGKRPCLDNSPIVHPTRKKQKTHRHESSDGHLNVDRWGNNWIHKYSMGFHAFSPCNQAMRAKTHSAIYGIAASRTSKRTCWEINQPCPFEGHPVHKPGCGCGNYVKPPPCCPPFLIPSFFIRPFQDMLPVAKRQKRN